MSKSISKLNSHALLYTQTEPFKLVSGLELSSLQLAYETYGELNKNKDNVILLHHSLSMSAHASNLESDNNNSSFDYNHKSKAGWWDNMIGKGKPLDPNKYHIICINNLGSCFGSTGPSNSAAQFPVITMHDIVNSQKTLLDYLGIKKIKLIIGSSMGGMISLAWIQLFPNSFDSIFVAACSHKAYPINIFNRMIQQEIIALDKSSKKQRTDRLKLARMLGYYNYRSDNELNERFSDIGNELSQVDLGVLSSDALYKQSELYKYFSYNSDKFVSNFDTDSYVCLLTAMDLFDLTVEKSYHPAGYPQINSNTKITVVAIDSDMLFPSWQQKEIYDLLLSSGYKPKYIKHQSSYGHDAFLIEHEQFGKYLLNILESNDSDVSTTIGAIS